MYKKLKTHLNSVAHDTAIRRLVGIATPAGAFFYAHQPLVTGVRRRHSEVYKTASDQRLHFFYRTRARRAILAAWLMIRRR